MLHGTFARLTLCFVMTALLAFAPFAMGAKPKNNKGDKGKTESVTGVVQAISKNSITIAVDGEKTKLKVFLINDKTQITGNIVRGGNASVTPEGNTAKSISAS